MTSYFSSTKPLHMICLWAGQYDGGTSIATRHQPNADSIITTMPNAVDKYCQDPMGGMEWWNGFFSGDLFFSGIFIFCCFFPPGGGSFWLVLESKNLYTLGCHTQLFGRSVQYAFRSSTTGQKPWVSFPRKCILSAVSCLSVPMPSRSVGKVIKSTKDG